MKICSKCNIEKEILEFSKNSNWCKSCRSGYNRNYKKLNKGKILQYNKEYRSINRDRIIECNKNYKSLNKEIIDIKNSEYRKNNKEDIIKRQSVYKEKNYQYYLDYNKKYREDNKEYFVNYRNDNRDKINKYMIDYRSKNPHITAWRNILRSIENNLLNAKKEKTLIRMDNKKSSSTIEMLGYSPEDLKVHLESLFEEGMSWDNHGDWHIDHIKPVSLFDPSTDTSIVNALENLQPLWASENLSKGNKII